LLTEEVEHAIGGALIGPFQPESPGIVGRSFRLDARADHIANDTLDGTGRNRVLANLFTRLIAECGERVV
jgi:hypothetical protein